MSHLGMRTEALSHLQGVKEGIVESGHLGKVSQNSWSIQMASLRTSWMPELRGILICLLNTFHLNQAASLNGSWWWGWASGKCLDSSLQMAITEYWLLLKSSFWVTLVGMVPLRQLCDSTSKAAWTSFWCECPMPASHSIWDSLHELLPFVLTMYIVNWSDLVEPWWYVASLAPVKCLCPICCKHRPQGCFSVLESRVDKLVDDSETLFWE